MHEAPSTIRDTLFAGFLFLAMTSITVAAIPHPPVVLDAHQDILLRLLDPESNRTLEEPGWTGQCNFENWDKGGINSIFFAVWVDPRRYPKERAVARAHQMIDCLTTQAARFPDRIMLCDTANDVRRAIAEKRIAALLGIEGGVAINDDIANVAKFRRRGVRYMTLTWRGNLKWAGSSQDAGSRQFDRLARAQGVAQDAASSGGLTEYGREIVHEMNRVGMIVDLSHVSDRTFFDALEVTQRPAMVSHSNARAKSEHPRNVTDDMLRALAKNGGVIGLNLWADLLDPDGKGNDERKTSVTVETVLDMIDHMVQVAGVDHVGFGTDFEGMSDLPVGLETAAEMPELYDGMRKRGYSESDLRKIAGENFLRVLEANDTPFASGIQ